MTSRGEPHPRGPYTAGDAPLAGNSVDQLPSRLRSGSDASGIVYKETRPLVKKSLVTAAVDTGRGGDGVKQQIPASSPRGGSTSASRVRFAVDTVEGTFPVRPCSHTMLHSTGSMPDMRRGIEEEQYPVGSLPPPHLCVEGRGEERTRRIREECCTLQRRMKLRRIHSEASFATPPHEGDTVVTEREDRAVTGKWRHMSLQNIYEHTSSVLTQAAPTDGSSVAATPALGDKVTGESSEDFAKAKDRINEALAYLREELRLMQTQDRQLLRRFLQIQAGIHLLTLHPRSRSTRCHTYSHHAPADDVSDDVIAQNRDRVDLYAADDVDDVAMTYETWPRRPRQRARMQSEPEHLVRTEYDSVTSCLPRFGLHPEEYEADEDEDEEAEEEDADTPTNSDAEPVFSPQHKHYFPCSPPPDFAPPKPPRTYASGGGGGGGVAMAAGNPVSRVDRQGAYVDIYDISDEDVRKRSRLWREAEREKQTTGSVDKKTVAALSVIM